MKNKNYGILNIRLIDRIIENKRLEMLSILKRKIDKNIIRSYLDIGTTEENKLKSSNFFLKKLSKIKIKKSITDQNIKKGLFNKVLKKSIVSNFSNNQISNYKSDLVVSSATIEHVGNFNNQLKMFKNIAKLTNKIFFITTPYRFFPLDFHTKLPFIHMLPKKIHRYILKILFLDEYAKEENLNLLDAGEIDTLINKINKKDFYIVIDKIKLFGVVSNLLITGIKK